MVRIVLIFLLGCATDYNQINKPIDTKEAIKDLQSIEVSSIKDSSIRERVKNMGKMPTVNIINARKTLLLYRVK